MHGAASSIMLHSMPRLPPFPLPLPAVHCVSAADYSIYAEMLVTLNLVRSWRWPCFLR